MKRLVLAIAVAVVAAVFVPIAASNPLEESSGFACGVIDGNGNFAITFDSHWVVQSSGRGQLDCLYKGPNDDGKREVLNYTKTGLLCGTPAGATTDWKNQISADGSVRLICAVENVDAAAAASGGYGLG